MLDRLAVHFAPEVEPDQAWPCSRPLIALILATILGGPLAFDVKGQDTDTPGLQDLEAQVAAIFGRSCARTGCHGGPAPQQGMDLSEDRFFASLVNEPSVEMPSLMRVRPGQPDSSYLVMKVRGAPNIIGARMPFTGDPLPEDEIRTIEAWIQRLGDADVAARAEQTAPAYPFDGWKAINLPTTRALDAGNWLFLISHRFNPRIGTGYDSFFGLDGSGIILLVLGYAITEDFLITLGRSNAADDVELQARYRFMQQGARWPVGIALHSTVNWITEQRAGERRFRSEVFKYTGQVSVTRAWTDRIGLAVVPGILVNPIDRTSGETPLLTLGLAARWRFHQNLSLLGEWVPIVSGFHRTTIFGNEIRFDSWGSGLEITTGGHVFQIVVSNTVGLATDQYLRGGDLDIRDGHVRLGFNIFRVLSF